MRLVLFSSQREPWKDGGHPTCVLGITPSKPHRASPPFCFPVTHKHCLHFTFFCFDSLFFHIQNVVKVSKFVDSISLVWLLSSCPRFSVYWPPLLDSCKGFSREFSTRACYTSHPSAHISPCHTLHTLLCVSLLNTKLPACPWHSGLPFLMPI